MTTDFLFFKIKAMIGCLFFLFAVLRGAFGLTAVMLCDLDICLLAASEAGRAPLVLRTVAEVTRGKTVLISVWVCDCADREAILL